MRRFALALLLTLAMAAPAAAETVLRVGDQKGNVQAVMAAAGVLDGAPYRIEWREFAAAAPLLEALNAGAIETGVVGDAPFTFAAAAGVPVKAIAAIRSNQAGLAVLVRKDSPVTTFADLKGKSIGTGKGSIGHQLVLAWLEKAGLAPADVKLVFLSPADAKAAYSTGSIDAWSTWEPYVAQEEILFGARRIATGEGVTPGLGFQVARDDAIANKREALTDFIHRYAAARAWSVANVESYAATWAKLMGLKPEVPLLWLSRARPVLAPIDASVVGDEQTTIDLYARSGLISKPLKAADVLDSSFNGAIASGQASLEAKRETR
ncbi:ABC transporter substrate-binding protein [Chelatococcus reniformis]|uniref:Putative aliphatic sulfonates-binding protein n=1 Tax=Chelatococcus reniformis TaxID=1494448 RepID=A0A916TX46_9HYPH|nr:ABC transporter substrate-binding protein [Chelatococcus reniformis]GGC49429.1 sulfonate ABC transporter substrate-binding protein [Chelatococcus reniformis]